VGCKIVWRRRHTPTNCSFVLVWLELRIRLDQEAMHYELEFVNLILIHFISIFLQYDFFELIVKLMCLDINYSLDNAYVE